MLSLWTLPAEGKEFSEDKLQSGAQQPSPHGTAEVSRRGSRKGKGHVVQPVSPDMKPAGPSHATVNAWWVTLRKGSSGLVPQRGGMSPQATRCKGGKDGCCFTSGHNPPWKQAGHRRCRRETALWSGSLHQQARAGGLEPLVGGPHGRQRAITESKNLKNALCDPRDVEPAHWGENQE